MNKPNDDAETDDYHYCASCERIYPSEELHEVCDIGPMCPMCEEAYFDNWASEDNK
jgi:hypothetical protein